MTSPRVKRFEGGRGREGEGVGKGFKPFPTPCGKLSRTRNPSRPPVENGEAAGETGDVARESAGRAKTVPDPVWTDETVPDPPLTGGC
jgi:hypothetical protein